MTFMQDAYSYTMHLSKERTSCMYKVTNPAPMYETLILKFVPTVGKGLFL